MKFGIEIFLEHPLAKCNLEQKLTIITSPLHEALYKLMIISPSLLLGM
jgi:hypothetical protein